ncbi:DUF1999 family protein [Oceanithermus sp.]
MHYRFIEEPDFARLEQLEKELLPGRPEGFYRCKPAALRFFARSNHSFVAADESGLHGFVLAQAVWQGDRATVLVTRIAAVSEAVYAGLLQALLKSAYDANAYEVALLAGRDERGEVYRAALAGGFAPSGLELLVRVLGSRGQRGETAGVFE